MNNLIDSVMNRLTPFSIILGRILLGLYFLVPGIMKFLQWDSHVMLMEKHNMPFVPVLLATAAIVQIIAGLGLIINRYTAVFAIVLAGLVIVINVNLHDFWNFSGELQNFIKNMAIFAGLLVLSGFSWKTKNH